MKVFVAWFMYCALVSMFLTSETKCDRKNLKFFTEISLYYAVSILIMSVFLGLPREMETVGAISYGALFGFISAKILSLYSKKGSLSKLAILIYNNSRFDVVITALAMIVMSAFLIFQINQRITPSYSPEIVYEIKLLLQGFSVIFSIIVCFMTTTLIWYWAEITAKNGKNIDGYT